MRRHETCIALVFLCAVGCCVDGLRGSELVLAAKAKAAEDKLNPTTEEIAVVINEDGTNSTVVNAKPLLTGIPQIDYIHDPNLPRELKGHNLTDYPFYNSVPKDIDFKCDGLHDGFYASVPHKCQLYHHCLFGTRYDFLCANYTAFDQKTFICHFVSEVDCKNSANYYIRNEELYKQASTAAPTTTRATTVSTTTTTTTEAPLPPRKGQMNGRRRRPYRRRRPVYEYYYEDEDEAYDEDYYEEDIEPPPRKASRRQQRPSGGKKEEPTTTTTTTTTTAAPPSADAPLTRAPHSVYAPRALPKIKRPVPINEKSKYDYTTKAGSENPSPTSNPKRGDDDYYYDDEEYDDAPMPPPSKWKDTGKNGRRRSQQPERKRPFRYDDEYEEEIEDEEEDDRPRMRKGNRKEDEYRPRNRPKSKKGQREDVDPIPSERPGYITPPRGTSRKRYQESARPERRRPDRRPVKGYDYYDEEEEGDSQISEERRRPSRGKLEKPRGRPKKPTTTTTSTTTTTTTSTTKPPPTTTSPSTSSSHYLEDDEEYEEYEYEDESIEEKEKENQRTTTSPTSPTPLHRFSTVSYRASRPTTTTTTEPSTRRSSSVSFRPRKTEYRRPNADELFSSPVGTPSGFKRVDNDNSNIGKYDPKLPKPTEEGDKTQGLELLTRRSQIDDSLRTRGREQSSRRPFQGQSYSLEDLSAKRQSKIETPQESDDKKRPSSGQEHNGMVSQSKPSGESQGFFIRKPIKSHNPQFQNKPQEDYLQTRPENPNFSNSQPSDDQLYNKQEVNPSNTGEYRFEEKKPKLGYSVPLITQGPPLPPVPQAPSYRRPFGTSGYDNMKRNNGEDQSSRKNKFDPFAPVSEVDQRHPLQANGDNSNKDEEQNYRQTLKPNFPSTAPDGFRRPSGPEGAPLKPINYRRNRPDKEPKKTLEELAYPGRRGNVPSQEPITEPGPNYRNQFYNNRPAVEGPTAYQPNKEIPVDFTAPGPSGEASTQRSLSSFDIGDEYDVTLNDALQPSTLNPTAQYARVKTRGYQSAVTHPSYRSLLVPAASQNYFNKAPPVGDQLEYETVLVQAQRFPQERYKQRRQNDWYW